MDDKIFGDIVIGSIWREVRGCAKEHVGSLVKVTSIYGDIIKWARIGYDVRDEGSKGSTCRSAFLYCFERPSWQITAPSEVTWPGAIWYHTNGGVHIAITIKEENGTVSYVSSDNKVLDLYWEMSFCQWAQTYKLYDGVVKPTCFPEGSFDEMLEETKGRYERVMERIKNNEDIKSFDEVEHLQSSVINLKTDESKMKEFDTGAKREDKSGKGRYDLIPGDIMKDFEEYLNKEGFSGDGVIHYPTDAEVSRWAYFDDWDNPEKYYRFIISVIAYWFMAPPTNDLIHSKDFTNGLLDMRNALAKHYEAGAKIHGVDNWKKGIPIYGSEHGGCFLDSMRRHTDQMLQHKTDEPHAISAIWNAFGALWTLKHRKHSAMYQNASVVKAEEDSSSNHSKCSENSDHLMDCENLIFYFHDVKHNLLKCIKILRIIVTNKNFIKLNSLVKTVYFEIYSTLVILNDIIEWFYKDQSAIDHITKILSDIYNMINAGTGHIRSCCKFEKMEWETCPINMRGFVCVFGFPDEDKLNILYETIGRAVNGLLNKDEKGLDPFCGLGITQSLARFNTDCITSRIHKE